MPCLRLNGRNYGGGSTKRWIISGSTAPLSDQGSDNCLYVRYDDTRITNVYCKINGEWVEFPSGGGSGQGFSFQLYTFTEGSRSNSTVTITDTDE